jgi:MoaA/NifB/PqqE/SkfB family radical SAM enzyme
METTRGPVHPTRFEDVAVTVDFHCNSACRFCIVQEGMNRYQGLPFERYEQLVAENARSKKYHRVVLTGGEVTLHKRLFEYAQLARGSGAFEYVRVQTNGRRLADLEYARALAAAGVNELFVSVHGHDPASHDDITQRPGSFDELVLGLRHAQALGLRVITNTVLTRRNLASPARIVALAAAHGVSRMEFWNYLPMEDHADERDLIAPLSDLMPALLAALDASKAARIPAITKYVPSCLLGEHADALDNSQPDTIIVEEFWESFPRFSCLFEAVCDRSEACLGLHHPYVNKWGWEAARLSPEPRTRPWAESVQTPGARAERYGTASEVGHPAWARLVEGAAAAAGATLARVQLTRNQARYLYELGEGARVEVVLAARDDEAPALARTRSFNVFYASAEGIEGPGRERLAALLRGVVDRVKQRDQGELTLDRRKGLLQVLPPERGRPRR